jgi:AcrR family transcriptional regulator
MADTATPTRQRLTREEREERMLEAGEQIFGAQGFRAASMDDIAEAAGITKALVYQYFESKEGLYVACVERARARFFDKLQERAGAAEFEERAHVLATAYLDWLDHHRDVSWILYGETSMEAIDEMRHRNAEAVSRLIRADLPTVADEDVEFLGQVIVGAGEQVGRWWLAHPEVSKSCAAARFAAAMGGAILAVIE